MSNRVLGAVTSPIHDPMRQQQAATASGWVNLSPTTTINDSENVSSITHNGTGDYTITWVSPLSGANYPIGAGTRAQSGGISTLASTQTAPTQGAVRVLGWTGVANDLQSISVAALDGGFAQSYSTQRWALMAETFIKYNDVPITPTIDGARNVSSLTDNAQGDQTINFTGGYSNANYCVCLGIWHNTNDFNVGRWIYMIGSAAPTASAVRVNTSYANGINLQDTLYNAVTIFGH